MDLQMYDRMLSIASKIEQNDYSNSSMEITLLFGASIWQEIEKIENLSDELKVWEHKQKRYWELCDDYGYNYSLEFEASREGASQKTLEAAEIQDKKFAVLVDHENFHPDIGLEKYDREEILSSISFLKNEINTLQNHLKDNIYDILSSKITLTNTKEV